MAAFNKVNCFVEDLAEKKHDLGADTLKVLLTNTAPTAASAVIGDITQIANGNGYTTGGLAVTISSSSQTSGTYKLVLADLTITATGTLGPFRYFVLYNDTSASDSLIGWWDYLSSVTMANTETFTVDFHATNGAIQIA